MMYQLNDNTTCNILGKIISLCLIPTMTSGIFNRHKITPFLNGVLQGTDTQLNPMKRLGHPETVTALSHPVGGRGRHLVGAPTPQAHGQPTLSPDQREACLLSLTPFKVL